MILFFGFLIVVHMHIIITKITSQSTKKVTEREAKT